jgi:hypothetical protein
VELEREALVRPRKTTQSVPARTICRSGCQYCV